MTTFRVRSSGRENEVNAILLVLSADWIFLKLVGHFVRRRTEPLELILAVKSFVLSSVTSNIDLADLRQSLEFMMIGGMLILVIGLGLRDDGLLVAEAKELLPLEPTCSDPATEADRERLPLSMITFESGFCGELVAMGSFFSEFLDFQEVWLCWIDLICVFSPRMSLFGK
uniref:Uncharacterized protein n=1 Tax=Schizaphis graminum TaxID=13262 RepID=A0A2S2PCK6_SCHGA